MSPNVAESRRSSPNNGATAAPADGVGWNPSQPCRRPQAMRGAEESGGPLRFTLQLGRHKVTVKIEQTAPDPSEPIPTADVPDDTAADVLRAATHREQTRKALIRASGHPVNSHTYGVVRELLRAGRLVLGPGGG